MTKLAQHIVSYFKEEMNADVVSKDYGFYIYSIFGKECFISDVYIEPEFRGKSLATEMIKEITVKAKEHGCDHLSSNIIIFDNDYTKVNKKLGPFLGVGLKVCSSSDKAITFRKDI